MTVGSILLSISLLIIVLGFLTRPFFASSPTKKATTNRLDLLAHKNGLLAEIQALDDDLESDLITPIEHKAQRAQLVKEAAFLLRQFESATPQTVADQSLDAKIEAAVAEIRGLDNADEGTPCPTCDAPTRNKDKFCANCGQQLQQKASPS